MRSFLPLVLLAALGLTRCASESNAFMGMPLLYSEDFESGEMDRWDPTDPNAWRIEEIDGNHVLSQFVRNSDYEPPVRSPFNRAILQDLVVSDFVLEARVRSTIDDYNHRDMCLFYGYQDPSNFYYTHFGKAADPHAHSIFIVNEAPRVSIAAERTDGTPWTDDWHTLRIIREVEPGTIQVYFDDMDTPIMTAVDTSFTWGRIGVGSFDDTGQFDDIRVWGRLAKP